MSSNCQQLSTWSTIVDTNSNKPLYYLFTASVNKFNGSCNTIDDPYARICNPNKAKTVNVKVFDLRSEVNEARFLVQQ